MNSSKCEYCEQPFNSLQGLQAHQSRNTANNFGCHRLQTLKQKESNRAEAIQRKEAVKNVHLQKHHADVSMGPHEKGSPITAKEKKCILNLYQSFVDEGKSNKDARDETARRLQFGIKSVTFAIKEKLSIGEVHDNKTSLMRCNAYEKLSDEEISDLRKLVHDHMRKCNVKRMNEENEDVVYPTIGSLHKAVLESGNYPQWSYWTFREILLSMNIKMKSMGQVDRSILIEDQYIQNWRVKYLDNMERYRLEDRPIFYMDETYINPMSQPHKLLTDCSIRSAAEAKSLNLSTGIKWNASRGNRLLILHMIGDNGLVHDMGRIWIHTSRTVQSDDYHNDIDGKTFYEWFEEALNHLPLNSVVVLDNASIHNKRAPGTPTYATKKADMKDW